MWKKHKTEIILLLLAIAAIIIYFLYHNNSSASQSTNTITPDTSGTTNGTININFSSPSVTTGIQTYIPLFGFLRL